MDPFILLVGRSGSGKTTVSDHLEKIYGMKQVKSYTTRKKRYDTETSHIFSNLDTAFNDLRNGTVVAVTLFDDNYYWANSEQIENSDIYVIDLDGVEYFLKQYHGKKKIIVIFLDIIPSVAFNRMLDRGDHIEDIIKRMTHDEISFSQKRIYSIKSKCNFHRINTSGKTPNDIAEDIISIRDRELA